MFKQRLLSRIPCWEELLVSSCCVYVVGKKTKTKHIRPYPKEQMKLTKVSGALDPCSNELVWPGSW